MTPRAITAFLVLALWTAASTGATAAKPKPTAAKPGAVETKTAAPKGVEPPPLPSPLQVPLPVPPIQKGHNSRVGPDSGQFLPDSAVLARVGARTIRVGQFVERYFAHWAAIRPAADSAGRADFLKTMVTKDVLGQVALGAYREDTFEESVVMREHSDRVLSNVLYQRAVYDSIRVREEDAWRIYPQYSYEMHLKRLVFRDSAVAARVREGLAKGRMTWTVAAAQQGLPADQGLIPEGDLGWVKRTALDPEIATTVFDLKPGQLSPVLFEYLGLTVYQAVETRPIGKADYGAIRSGIIDELKLLQAARRSEAMLAGIRTSTGMVHDTANIVWAAKKFPEVLSSGGPDGRTIEMDTSVPEFDRADTSRVLARFHHKTFTLGQFLSWYEGQNPYSRVSANTFQALRRQVDIAALEPDMAKVARERGLERDAMAVELIGRRREELRVERLFQDSVASKVRVTDKDRRDYWKDHMAEFITEPRVRFATFHAESQAEADSLLARLKSGESAEAVLRADSLAGHPRGAIWWRGESDRGATHQQLLFGLRPGDATIAGAPDGHWDVIRLLEIDPGHQLRMEEAERVIDESVQNIAGQRLLDDLVERHKRTMRVEAHPELVMRIRLVDPTL